MSLRASAALVAVIAIGCGDDAEAPDERCGSQWRLELDGAIEGLAASPNRNTLYAIGRKDELGYVGAIDACAGELRGETTLAPDGASAATLSGAAAVGDSVYAVGASQGDGLLARIDGDDALAYASALGDADASETLFDVALAADGSLWAAAEVVVGGATTAAVVRVGTDGAACPIALEGDSARAVTAEGDHVRVGLVDGTEVRVLTLSECRDCGCAPIASDGWDAGTTAARISALRVRGGTAWLSGFMVEGVGVGQGFVVRYDLASGAVEAATRFDPSDGVDAVLDVALRGETLLFVGAVGWEGDPGFDSAQGVIGELPLDFAEGEQPGALLEAAETNLLNGVAVEAESARFWFSGLIGDGRSIVAQCRATEGGCEGSLIGEWTAPPDAPDGGVADAGIVTDGGDMGPAASAVPQIDPRDGRRFVRSGQPWYPTGYYPGAALNMTGSSYANEWRVYNEELIERLASEGIDLFRVWINWGALPKGSGPIEQQWDRHVLTPYARTGPGTAIDGEPRVDLDTWNEAYFTEIEHAIDYAGARGIVVQVMTLDCWHAGFGRSFDFQDYDYFAAANNINGVSFDSEAAWFDTSGEVFARNRQFAREVVRRVGDRENIIWETCNEPRPIPYEDPVASATHPFHAMLAAAIHAEEDAQGHPRHLVMPVDLPEHRTVAGHRTPAPTSAQSVDAFRAELVSEQFAWELPLISDNDCCPGEPDADLIRRKAWAAITAGAHLDVFNNELFQASVLRNMNTTLGMRYVALPGRLVRERSIDLAGMTPCDATVTPARWCFGRADERIVYLEGGGAVMVSGLAGAVDAVFFDPRNGATSDAGDGPTFTPPDGRDWALHIR